jgi:hypothetical protein
VLVRESVPRRSGDDVFYSCALSIATRRADEVIE